MSKLPCANTMIFKKYPPLKSGPPEISVIQREFRRNEGSTDHATIPEVTLTGDFVIEFDCLVTPRTSGNTTQVFLAGSTQNTTERFYVGASEEALLIGNGSLRTVLSGVVVADNLLHKIKFYVQGGSLICGLDGVQVYSEALDSLAYTSITNLWSGDASGFITQGILANLKIYDAGTLIRNYPINDGKNILANAATALGNEIDGLTYALTTAIGGVASVVLTSLSVIGKTYLVEVSYSGVVGDASVRIGGFSGPSFTGTGSHSFVATTITTVNDILGALTGVTSGSVTVSIKEAEGYGTIINGNADDWGLFDKQANGDWKGNGLAVPPWDSVDQVLVTA